MNVSIIIINEGRDQIKREPRWFQSLVAANVAPEWTPQEVKSSAPDKYN